MQENSFLFKLLKNLNSVVVLGVIEGCHSDVEGLCSGLENT